MKLTKLHSAKAHQGPVMSIKVTECGNFLVTCGNDRKIRLWSYWTGELYPINYAATCASSLPYTVDVARFFCLGDDLLIVPGSTGNIDCVPIHSSTGSSFLSLKSHLAQACSIQCLHASKQVISSGRDGLVVLWAGSGRPSRLDELVDSDEWSDDDQAGLGGVAVPPPREFIPPIIRDYLNSSQVTPPELDVSEFDNVPAPVSRLGEAQASHVSLPASRILSRQASSGVKYIKSKYSIVHKRK